MPNDANPHGTVFGGRVMQFMDIAAAICGHRHARCQVVTLSVDSLVFRRPIRVGQAMVLRAWMNWVGNSSMEIQVDVFSEDMRSGERALTSTAFLTFVALDDGGGPRRVPPLRLETPEEELRFREAAQRREERLRHRPGEG